MNFAGRFKQAIDSVDPNSNVVRSLGYGALGAGSSVLANALSPEQKSMDRVAAEAIGAGAAGGLAGYGLARLRNQRLGVKDETIKASVNQVPQETMDQMQRIRQAYAQGEPLIAGGLGLASVGLGNAIGGGIANAAGVPQGIDPESYTSSNSMNNLLARENYLSSLGMVGGYPL